MARARTRLNPYLSAPQLRERYRTCTEVKEARRWHALWLISQGQSAQEAARTVGLCPAWVRRVVQGYNTDGPSAVRDGHSQNPGGRRSRVSGKQQQHLSQRLERPPPDGGLWSGAKVALWLEQQTGQKTYPQLGCVYLRRLGLTLQQPRRRHGRAASRAQQSAFKKNSAAR
jgi:transposase